MGKAVPIDHNFDKEKLAELINSTRGPLSQAEFAKEVGITQPYYNKCVRGKLENPPTPRLLSQFAHHSRTDVSFEQLLVAAGYDPSKYLSLENKQSREVVDIQMTMNAILLWVSSLSDRWKYAKEPTADTYSMLFEFSNSDMNQWEFYFFPSCSDNNDFADQFVKYNSHLAQSTIDRSSEKVKTSLVFQDESTYRQFLETVPKVPYQASAILVDAMKLIVEIIL